MEEMASLWSYQENVDEIRQKLVCTTIEFEQFKAETSEELMKRNEYVCQLIQLLKDVSQERDEAKDQLQKLVNKVLPSSTVPIEFISSIPFIQNENPVFLKSTKGGGNSSITESNSLSEVAVNYNSHGSPPVDSFFDAVSSPDLPNINMADSNNNVGYLSHRPMLIQDSNLKVSMEMPNVDHATLIMDNLIKGKPLPQKGKFLKAVLDVPPLLHSLLLAGPLPKWRNPPRLQTFQIPPFPVPDSEVAQQKQVTNFNYGGLSMSQNYNQMSSGSSQMSTIPMFNFAPPGSCLGASNLGYTGANLNNFVSLAKRQRLQ